MPAMITTMTKNRLQIHRVQAAKGARLNARTWQAIAGTERLRDDAAAAVVEVTDDRDTVIVASWTNWKAILAYIDALEAELAELKGDKTA